MNNPAYIQWVLMRRGSEQKLVHPGNVGNHLRFGWTHVEEPKDVSLTDDVPSVSVAVETPASVEEIPGVEEVAPAESEVVEESTTESLRDALTPKRSSRSKKDK